MYLPRLYQKFELTNLTLRYVMDCCLQPDCRATQLERKLGHGHEYTLARGRANLFFVGSRARPTTLQNSLLYYYTISRYMYFEFYRNFHTFNVIHLNRLTC